MTRSFPVAGAARRYALLLFVQLRLSLLTSVQYRAEFFVDALLGVIWVGVGLVPLSVAFAARPGAFGWTYERALVVLGWFTLLKGVLDGAVNPSLAVVVERIRKGTLDFTLLKPADAQFLVSTAKFEFFRAFDGLLALFIFAWAFARMGRCPRPSDVALSLFLLVLAITVLYSIWILVIAAAFWVVRLDNLAYLFNAIFDFARWPVSVFKGVWALLFTFVIPLAVMTTYPAEALLGELAGRTAALSALGAVFLAALSRFVWSRAVAHYRSASS